MLAIKRTPIALCFWPSLWPLYVSVGVGCGSCRIKPTKEGEKYCRAAADAVALCCVCTHHHPRSDPFPRPWQSSWAARIKPWLFQPGVPCLLGNGGNGDKKLGNFGPESTKLKQNFNHKVQLRYFFICHLFSWHRESTSRPLKRHYFRGSSTALCVFRARPDGPDCQDQILLILQWEVEPETPNKGSICAESNLIADQRS